MTESYTYADEQVAGDNMPIAPGFNPSPVSQAAFLAVSLASGLFQAGKQTNCRLTIPVDNCYSFNFINHPHHLTSSFNPIPYIMFLSQSMPS